MLVLEPTNFSQLPYELRSMIWTLAAVVQIQHITDTLPRMFSSESAERRRQTFMGYDSLSPDQTKLPLILRIMDPYAGCSIRLEEDGFEGFVNCLPMSAVCREARSHAAGHCRTLVTHMALEYDRFDVRKSLAPPEKDAHPV